MGLLVIRREHYHESERMIQTVLDGSSALVGKGMLREEAARAMTTFQLQLEIAKAHAMLATASAYVAGEVGHAYGGNLPIDAPQDLEQDLMDAMKEPVHTVIGEEGEETVIPLRNAGKLILPLVVMTEDTRDTPKMVVETLNVCASALTVYEEHTGVSAEYVQPHRERVARLIKAVERGVQ